MENKFVSVCILAWQRPGMLIDCLDSLNATLDYPAEIIVNVDGESDIEQEERSGTIAAAYFNTKKISKLLVNNGKNRGVGRSFQNCLGVAEGDIIVKCDSDITFERGWLSSAVHALENNPDVGAISLFNYNNYDPKDDRFKILESRSDCDIVSDFVSSIYVFRARGSLHLDKQLPDDGLHQTFGKMAITKKDYVKNVGFGLNSVYLTFDEKGNPSKAPTSPSPLIYTSLT